MALVLCAYLLNDAASKLTQDQKALSKPQNPSEPSAGKIWESNDLIGSFVPFWKQLVIQAHSLAAAGGGTAMDPVIVKEWVNTERERASPIAILLL